MKRRQLVRYAQAGLLATLGMGAASGLEVYRAQKPKQQSSSGLTLRWLGHTCFLFTGEGKRILVNPFRNAGCTAKYRLPRVETDLVLISSQLLDEGFVESIPGNPRLLYQPGLYQFRGSPIQGVSTDHDRQGGRRFGSNIVWSWNQGGVRVVHLGGTAAPITLEQKILIGRPDVLIVPVGGGLKAYNAQEAKQAVQELNPRLIIPTHYRTQAADPAACDISPVDEFLTLMDGTPISRPQSDAISVRPADLPPQGMRITVLSYKF